MALHRFLWNTLSALKKAATVSVPKSQIVIATIPSRGQSPDISTEIAPFAADFAA